MNEYMTYDAVGLAELIKLGETTPQDLLTAARERANEVNPRINAIVTDINPPEPAGSSHNRPFSGVPFLIKDALQHLAGYPTSNGSRAMAKLPATESATVVQRWINAGLVIFGKTNTAELGLSGVTEPELFGAARNPWNTNHTPGGSSGGAGAAVAAGIVPCAGANDGGGSIRIPASACGLIGLKVSRGLIPAGPTQGEHWSGAGTDGVISRSVRDTAAMLDIMIGPTPLAPYVCTRPSIPYLDEVKRAPGRLRVAACVANTINKTPHSESVTAVRHAADLLNRLGHDVVELEQSPIDDAALIRDFVTIVWAHCAFAVDEAKAVSGSGDTDFELATRLAAALGRATKPADLIRASHRRHEYIRQLAKFQAQYDLLLTPTLASPPPRIGAHALPMQRRGIQLLLATRAAGLLPKVPSLLDQLVADHLGWMPYTQLANMTGRPAITIPLHWTSDSLPIGVQFTGRLGAERLLIRLAAQLEQAQPWAARRPNLEETQRTNHPLPVDTTTL
ncbi:amidase [Mycolicibacterium farcinogenes]|uniref:Amidase n=1 Tax=Mycolicibacterium farcinogenes TaxID=1802 RepID=A0ACD1FQS7_MYCFR|nr:amidase [Mycolicibacterium farcinogenes]QZH69402.1 amidase [Mycolicibacterium farcinogenes]